MTKEAFDEWKDHPVTKEISLAITQVKQDLLEKVSTGVTIGQTADETHGMTNRMLGHIEGLDQLLGIDFPADEAETISEEDN